MTTYLLTPASADTVTGLKNSVIGWQLTAATALDVLEGMDTIVVAGYNSDLKTVDITKNPPIYALVIVKPGAQPVTINDTDWLVFDGQHAWGIPQATVAASYTVTAQS